MADTGIEPNSRAGKRILAVVAVLILLAVGFYWWSFAGANTSVASSGSKHLVEAEEAGYSNVRAADYVGASACEACHEERYTQWSGNLHRKMNRLVSEQGAVLGDFGNRRIKYGAKTLVLEQEGDDYWMSFEESGKVVRRYRVTRTIGSRYLQEYVGIQVVGPEPSGDSAYETEIRLPFGYLLGMKRWLHQQYFDSWHDREYSGDSMTHDPFEPDKTPWRSRCAWCHNTYPFENRLARMQGEEKVGSGIEQLFSDLREDQRDPAERLLLDTETLVSVGISCESCHFGAREHVENGAKIRFAPQAPSVVAVADVPALSGERTDNRSINAICAQCHSVPTQLYPNGAGTRNSSEALDLLIGNCASEIKCTDCHDPHVPGPGAMSEDSPKHLAACTGCHEKYADAGEAAFHSLHGPEVSCLDCHMPRITQGLASLIRSHRISTPGDLLMLQGGVNACNLCHLDKSVAWTVNELAVSRGLRLPGMLSEGKPWPEQASALWWLESEERILRLTAAGALGISGKGREYLGTLLRLLDDPNAYDRLRYMWAIEGILGRELSPQEYDVSAPPEVRKRQAAALWTKENS